MSKPIATPVMSTDIRPVKHVVVSRVQVSTLEGAYLDPSIPVPLNPTTQSRRAPSPSKILADRAVRMVSRTPGMLSRELCDALCCTKNQLHAATPYIKTHCTRIKCEWYMK